MPDHPNPFAEFPFEALDDSSYKEDAVREDVVKPLLNWLGYSITGPNRMIRSFSLSHPIVQTGSGTRQITIIPDYLLESCGKPLFVLDAKAPDEDIASGPHVEQAYFYAIHPDIRVRLYALCNGKELSVFTIDKSEANLHFSLSEFQHYAADVRALLSPEAFSHLPSGYGTATELGVQFDYSTAQSLAEIKPRKQAAKRHFGVHGYFTRQSWNVVQAYIKNFTKPGDLVLDPFGGYGVTLLESLVLRRRAIHVDINPLSLVIIEGLVEPIELSLFRAELDRITTSFDALRPKTVEDEAKLLSEYPYPSGASLSADADADTVEGLFSRRQLAELALLKHLIGEAGSEGIRKCLRLCFSSTLTKVNLTYHPSTSRGENAGDAAAFRYYRHRLASTPVVLDTLAVFTHKANKLIAAKREIEGWITPDVARQGRIIRGSAASLPVDSESVDDIYTDPPYGNKIAYLDLSVMWNEWLDVTVSEEDYAAEAIEGGSRGKSRADYSSLIAQSLTEMYRVLKFDRWMSFVFQHQDPAYWHMIRTAAESAGFEYAGTISQRNGQTTFKKRQHPFTVLHGQLIINFRKKKTPRAALRADLGMETADLILQTVEAVIARDQGATLEEINSELVVRGMELGFLHELAERYQDISPLLNEHFDLNRTSQKYQIRANGKFKTKIPLELRIRYYLVSFLRGEQRSGKFPTFDQIVLNIMPLLQNGITPEEQTILNVLECCAIRVEDGRWRLNESEQGSLFQNV